MRSSRNQRVIVEAEMVGMMRWAIADRTISAADQRESGRPDSRGNVQARAVIRALTVEGKKARGPRPLRFGQRSAVPPPLAPFLNGPHGGPQLTGRLGVVPLRVFVGDEDDLGPNHAAMAGCFSKATEPLELRELFKGERNRCCWFRSSWHGRPSAAPVRRPHCSVSRFIMSKPYANL